MGNIEVIHTGTSIFYEWDILGSSIYIVDILRIDDLRIDDHSSILRSSIYRVLIHLASWDTAKEKKWHFAFMHDVGTKAMYVAYMWPQWRRYIILCVSRPILQPLFTMCLVCPTWFFPHIFSIYFNVKHFSGQPKFGYQISQIIKNVSWILPWIL